MAKAATEDMPASFEGAIFAVTSGMVGIGTGTGNGFSVVVCGCSLVRCAATVLRDDKRKGVGEEEEEEEEEEAGRWASRRGRRRRVGWKAATGGSPQDRHSNKSRTPCCWRGILIVVVGVVACNRAGGKMGRSSLKVCSLGKPRRQR
jgi:hypothetical protein